jgi:hypothetical protein
VAGLGSSVLVEEQPVGRWRRYSLADREIAERLEGFEVFVAKIGGTEPAPSRHRPRRFLYLCPDWTMTSFHLGGAVGAALLRPCALSVR